MPRYCAHYKCRRCGAERLQTERAADYSRAPFALPRWIYPDGHAMRRQGAPKLYKDK